MNNVTKKWVLLKISTFILIPLMTWFIINLVNIYDKEYAEVLKFFLRPSGIDFRSTLSQ